MVSETKNQKGWKRIDEKLHFLDKINRTGEFYIKAKQIKEISNREPRLMAKFDHSTNLPKIFKDNSISILPVSGSSYKLFKFDSYQVVVCEETPGCIEADFLEKYKTINVNDIRSEDKAILVANMSKMILTFTGESDLQLTNKGKFGTGIFNFKIETYHGLRDVNVNGAGAELDAGFEGDKFYLLEAKMGKADDFNIRQLYYPFRYWREKIKKEVVPIFLTYSDNTFNFWQFRFLDDLNFNSIQQVKHENYYIDIDPRPDLGKILDSISDFFDSDFSNIPFPQADDFEKVINIVELVSAGTNQKEEFADEFSFDRRQADYYFNAAKYLGLVDKKRNAIFLTEFGRKVADAARNKRHSMLIKAILSRKVCYDTFLEFRDEKFDKERVLEIMLKNGVLTKSTDYMRRRRSSTIISWCKWINNIIKNG